ncbi:MAG: tRNA (adenosine(37)-N6)-threonylcarbamoyltransferase complex transferase subunit TsaD [Acidobacteriaceae bacterium]
MKNLNILAIETSCDETAAAVIRNGQIISNVIASQADLHAKFGGIVPEVAAREHITAMIPTVDLALRDAGLKLDEIDQIAVTAGPGLMTSLLVGVDTAKALASSARKPLVAINHLEAHVYANLVDNKDLKFPAIILVVSGGHTLLVLMKKHGDYKILGETVDDAAGEAFDKTAKLMGLGYPGGPMISRFAEKGNSKAFDLPRPMLKNKTLNFSFSGLKTAVLYEYQKHKPSEKLTRDMAASVQQAIVDTLMGKLEQAITLHKPKSIMLGGGVAANKLLRKSFADLANKYRLKFSIPKFEYCTDNAAMIGLAAYYRLKNKKARVSNETLFPNPQLKLK